MQRCIGDLDRRLQASPFPLITNPLQRVNKEIKRRANVIGIFPNDGAIIRLIGTLVIEQTEESYLTGRYMSYESLAKVVKPESAERLWEKQAVA